MRLLRKINLWLKTSLVDLLLKIYGVKIVEAKTEEQKKAVYRLRYQIYKEYGYIDPADFPNGEMRDEDDDHSISFLALKNNQPVGTIRLIYGQKKEDFPTFRMWNVDFSKFSVPFSKIGEISKAGIIKPKKKLNRKKRWIWLEMIKIIYQKCKMMNLDYCVFTSHYKMKSFVEKILNTPVYSIPCLKKAKIESKERKLMSNRFKSLNPLPYFVKVKEFGSR